MSERSRASRLSLGRVLRTQRRYWLVHLVLLAGGLVMVFPFVYQLLMSVATDAQVRSVPPTLVPDTLHWENYAEVFTKLPFLKQFGTSVLITVARTAGQVVLASMAGYAFARMPFRGRGILFGALLLILMVPGQSYLIGQYRIVRDLGLLETPWGIVAPGLFSAFATFLMRQAFMGLPNEMEEAARLDGANQWQIFWRIMLPLVRPSLFAVMITTVLWSWNDLLWPLIVTSREENMPLSVGIATLAGQHSTDYTLMMAASTMAMAPIFLLFFTMQKRVIEGLASSGVKG
ncbi:MULTISPECIES: carbohydrate ABC transporter permease [unclassified Actinomyces]|uniref:carbohydrate ABC transporter permease n=1 Tax=unclassified Actinomyces TaxID=2609248 RepID=UPI002017D839|nr:MULTISPECIES: carbohydrate ABC transporter permease [unclassified Actinomyces]MCL3777980.1 carbohydrate ABC transporter permease [Actinomyces sp. AC-20-1]MCL3789633.1 carbohydrate ABC transporter permease [Actinomyces sp. 187325]MCL3792003.1 carbohydrate ABC transporter permease [Actinomyces sp. 186855]MCL3794673.1 carbohydrate ABC transporter permease [Actinomyces sp. 217892]